MFARPYPDTTGQQVERGWRFGWIDAIVILAVFVLLWLLIVLSGDMRVQFDELHSAPALPRRRAHPLLHGAHGAADVHRLCRGAPVHLRLWLRRGQERARTQGHAAAAGHPPVGAGPGLSFHHGDRLPGALSGEPARGRMRQHLRYLHGAGMEHDVRLLSLADHHSGRAAGSRLRLQASTAGSASPRSSCRRRRSA